GGVSRPTQKTAGSVDDLDRRGEVGAAAELKLHVQPRECLERARLCECTGVDDAEARLLTKACDGGLGGLVVARDEQVERLTVLLSGDDVAGEDGVEGLDD